MTMREDLARRLHEVVTTPPYIGTDPGESPFWLLLADECVRQMEWARRPFAPVPPIEEGAWSEQTQWKPLVLAPEGWKP